MYWNKRTFGVVALMAVLALGIASSGCVCPGTKDTQRKVNQLSNRVDMLESDLAELREECEQQKRMGRGLSMRKTMPDEVRKGQEFDYQIEVTNETDEAVSNVKVTERMQNGMQLVSADPQPRGGPPYQWRIDKMEAGETRTINVTARATKTGTLESCATHTFESPVCDALNVVQPALKVVKKGPDQVLICDNIPLTYTVTNSGSGVAEDVVLSETLPQGMVTQDGNRKISKEIGDLPSGESRTVKVVAKAQSTGTFTNQATAKGEGLSSKSNTHKVAVRQPVLKISKNAPQKKFVDQSLEYQIKIRNTGDAPAEDTVVTDELPDGIEFVSASHNGQADGGTIRWELGTLQPGNSQTLTAELEAAEQGSMTNRVMAEAVCAKEATATAKTQIAGIPAILLEVVDVSDPIEVGNEETYRITATNQGSEAARNVQITVNLEDEMEYLDSDGPTNGQHQEGTVTFQPLSRLQPGDQATWTVQVRAAEAGNVRLSVKMTSEQLGERPVTETEATNFYE